MAETAVEHVEQGLAGQSVGRAGVCRRRHRRGHGLVGAQACRDHPAAQVAVGHDPEYPVAGVDHDRGRGHVRHQLRRLPDRSVRADDHGREADQLGHRLVGRIAIGQAHAGLLADDLEQRAGDEAQARRGAEQLPRDVRPDPVTVGVLGGPSFESGR